MIDDRPPSFPLAFLNISHQADDLHDVSKNKQAKSNRVDARLFKSLPHGLMAEVTEQSHVNCVSCFLHVLCILIIPPLLCMAAVVFLLLLFNVVYCTLAINFARAAIWVIEEQT